MPLHDLVYLRHVVINYMKSGVRLTLLDGKFHSNVYGIPRVVSMCIDSFKLILPRPY